jgi:hypothetical protein
MKDFRYGFGAFGERQSDEVYERGAIPSPAKPFSRRVANFTLHTESEVDTANASGGPTF